jgi:uncharacterized protein with FMN-binding domain
MARKLNKNLIALGSAAIVGVYALGYARTQPGTDQAVAAVAAGASAMATPSPVGAASESGQASPIAAYRDGVYTGSGHSRAGGIDVVVTVQRGKIATVQITHATTYFPAARIARLPGVAVERQTAQVDFVSGATESSRAFRDALTQALGQATVTATVAMTAPAPT